MSSGSVESESVERASGEVGGMRGDSSEVGGSAVAIGAFLEPKACQSTVVRCIKIYAKRTGGEAPT